MRPSPAFLALALAFCPAFLPAQASLASLSPARKLADYPPGFYDGDPLPAKTAYLTFDDGPCDFTSEILDLLERESVRATFFVCARWARENWAPGPTSYDVYASDIARMYADGNAVGNHTADHRNLSWPDKEGILAELAKNRYLLEWAVGLGYPRMTLTRPPFGAPWFKGGDEGAMRRAAKALASDSMVILWNEAANTHDSDDYVKGEWYTLRGTDRGAKEFRAKADKIAQRVSDAADGRGIVVLMHDTHPTSLAALPRVIALLKARGYSFATMEDWVRWRYGASSQELLAARDARLSLAGPAGKAR